MYLRSRQYRKNVHVLRMVCSLPYRGSRQYGDTIRSTAYGACSVQYSVYVPGPARGTCIYSPYLYSVPVPVLRTCACTVPVPASAPGALSMYRNFPWGFGAGVGRGGGLFGLFGLFWDGKITAPKLVSSWHFEVSRGHPLWKCHWVRFVNFTIMAFHRAHSHEPLYEITSIS
jgi:hypothetical protein